MANTLSVLVWSTLFLFAALILLLNILKEKESRNCKLRPPGPPAWPIFGNFFDLGNMPHQSLYKLRAKYGPVLWLKLGSVNTVVIQSAKAANEMFKNQDHIFCDRKVPDALIARNYYQGSLAFGRYGVYWRILRLLCASELSFNRRINETAPIRRKCIDKTIQCIENDVAEAQVRGESGQVDLSHYLFLMAFSLIGNLTLSRELLNLQSKQELEFFAAMVKCMEWVGKPNMSDYFPFLRSLDPQGIRRNMMKDMGCVLQIISGYVKERLDEQKLLNDEKKDFLDGLIKYEGDGKEGPDKLSDQNINIIVTEMFLAGSETTSSTMEWAVAELLRNPEAMRKTKDELDRVVGRNRKVEEKDIVELPYFKAVLKETLRLHPPGPLLLPRNAMKDTEFMGYQIPKDTQVFVNVWTIGRDPDCWENPLSFKPERFLGSNVDFKGQHFELIPFGSGRRICVGISVADRLLHLGLASLLHHFDWELGQDATPESLDMNERFGIAVRKLVPLRVIPKKRIM